MDEFFVFSDDELDKTINRNETCPFVNVKGVQCKDKPNGGAKSCYRHRCTYMINDETQCSCVTDCLYEGYCLSHGMMCKCKYVSIDGTRCNNTVNYIHRKHEHIYCKEHRCSANECRGRVDTNDRHLCMMHYSILPVCIYKTKDGTECKQLIDDPYSEIEKSKESTINIPYCNTQRNYCCEHHCIIEGCFGKIVSDGTRYCEYHSVRCEYEHNGEQCSKYITPLHIKNAEFPCIYK